MPAQPQSSEWSQASPACGFPANAFSIGDRVETHSLSTAVLNGKQGTVVGFQDDRVKVELAMAGEKALKPANLKLVSEPSLRDQKLHRRDQGQSDNPEKRIASERKKAQRAVAKQLEQEGEVRQAEERQKHHAAEMAAVAELQDLFPQVDAAAIPQALALCHGNKELAAEWILAHLPQDDAPPTPSAYPHGQAAQRTHQAQLRVLRRKSVLVGINYFGTKAELRGCINDVWNMKKLLTETFGWDASCIRILVDDRQAPGNYGPPTKANIISALRWLAEGVESGDVLFFHFSGHGAQSEDPNGYEEDGMNETICPMDFQQAGMITDDEIGDMIVKDLPEGTRLTAIMDCCHSGTGLDLPFTWTGRAWKEETNPFHSCCDVQLFSGCEDEDCSADAMSAYGAPGGAMTSAFCDVLRAGPLGYSYPELMARLDKLMRKRGFSQRPQLTSSQMFDGGRPFDLDSAVINSNATLGRIFRRRFPPQPRPMEGPLADMLGIGMVVVGGMMAADMVGSMAGGGMDGISDMASSMSGFGGGFGGSLLGDFWR